MEKRPYLFSTSRWLASSFALVFSILLASPRDVFGSACAQCTLTHSNCIVQSYTYSRQCSIDRDACYAANGCTADGYSQPSGSSQSQQPQLTDKNLEIVAECQESSGLAIDESSTLSLEEYRNHINVWSSWKCPETLSANGASDLSLYMDVDSYFRDLGCFLCAHTGRDLESCGCTGTSPTTVIDMSSFDLDEGIIYCLSVGGLVSLQCEQPEPDCYDGCLVRESQCMDSNCVAFQGQPDFFLKCYDVCVPDQQACTAACNKVAANGSSSGGNSFGGSGSSGGFNDEGTNNNVAAGDGSSNGISDNDNDDDDDDDEFGSLDDDNQEGGDAGNDDEMMDELDDSGYAIGNETTTDLFSNSSSSSSPADDSSEAPSASPVVFRPVVDTPTPTTTEEPTDSLVFSSRTTFVTPDGTTPTTVDPSGNDSSSSVAPATTGSPTTRNDDTPEPTGSPAATPPTIRPTTTHNRPTAPANPALRNQPEAAVPTTTVASSSSSERMLLHPPGNKLAIALVIGTTILIAGVFPWV